MAVVKGWIYKWIDRLFLGGCSSYNTLAVRKSCRKKSQARASFAQNNIPYARGAIFFSPCTALQFVKEYGFPVVVKPNVSGFSRGSYFPIDNYFDLWKALILAKIWWPTSVIEEYLFGRNYRVLVIKGKIMSIIRRYPPFVTGDGSSTISALIDRENAIRKSMNLYPVIHPIPKNRQTRRFLKKHNLVLSSIPAQDQQITLHNKIALAPGGVIETLNKENIPRDNKEIFLKILDLFEANILGIDVIMEEGIESSYQKQKCIFLEINSRPYLKMHDVPRYGEKEDLAEYLHDLEQIDIDDAHIF